MDVERPSGKADCIDFVECRADDSIEAKAGAEKWRSSQYRLDTCNADVFYRLGFVLVDVIDFVECLRERGRTALLQRSRVRLQIEPF